MTEPGTAMAAGCLLPAACPPGPKAVTRPSLSGAGAGGSRGGGGPWGKSSPSPHTPNLLAQEIQTADGVGVTGELMGGREGTRPPPLE